MLITIVVVERPSVHEDLMADLAVVGLGLIQGPGLAQLVLHQPEHVLVTEAVMATQVHDVAPFKRAVGTLEWPGVGDALHDLLAEVGEQVDALVADFVHRSCELLATQLASRYCALDVNARVDWKSSEVGDVLKFSFSIPLNTLLLLGSNLNNFEIPGGCGKLAELEVDGLDDHGLEVLMTPDEVANQALPILVL